MRTLPMSYRVDIADGLPGVVVDASGNHVPKSKVRPRIDATGVSVDHGLGRVSQRADGYEASIEVDGKVIHGVPVFSSKPA